MAQESDNIICLGCGKKYNAKDYTAASDYCKKCMSDSKDKHDTKIKYFKEKILECKYKILERIYKLDNINIVSISASDKNKG